MDTKSRQAESLTPQEAPPPGTRPITAPPKKRRNPLATLMWAAVFVLVVIGIIIFALTRGGGSSAAGGAGGHGRGGRGGAAGAPTTVSVAQVGRGDVPIYLNELGTVTPLATVSVTSQISGYLQSLGFKEGQMVRKGQFLAQIDPRPYQAALLQAEGALARDQAALAEAELDLKRYRLLLSQDSIASQQVDLQAATVLQDRGTVKTDQAAIAADKLNIAYAHVTSPVTGRAGLRQVDVGNYVTAVSNVPNTMTGATGTSGIVVVTQLTPIDVEFTLPEDDLPQVEARLHAGASLPVVAFDRTGQNQLATGQLLALDSQVDPTTGTVKAKARFENGAGSLFPQQFVNVRVLVDTLHNAVIASNSAVLRGANGLYVYVVQGGVNHHTVTVKPVKTGETDGTNTAILSGANPGDTVVTDGTDRLREGAAVILPGDCIPSFAGAGGRGGHRRHAGGAGQGGAGQGAGQGGCPRGESRQTAAGAKAGADAASGSGGVGGPGAASQASGGQASADSGNSPEQPTAGQGQGGMAPGQNQGGRMQAMLAQLNLDPQQQLKAQALFTAARGEAMSNMASSGDNPADRHQAMHAAYDKAFGQLDAILRPDQKAKLAQLRAQMAAQRAQRGGDQGGGGQ